MQPNAPLSFQQQWLWDLMEQYPDWSNVLGYAYRLTGALDSECLSRALQSVVARHDSLHTTFKASEGVIRQYIQATPTIVLEVIPCIGDARKVVEAKLTELFERPIDHRNDARLLEFRLFELSEQEHILALKIHRIITDCTGVEQVFRDIWMLYQGKQAEMDPSSLTAPPQYWDYAAQQRARYSAWKAKHESFWLKRIAGATAVNWPRKEAPVVQRGAVGRMSCNLDKQLTLELHEFARSAHSLSATVMLAIYAVAISRWCGQTDFVIPFNVAGRQSQHRTIVGYFSHLLYLRISIPEDDTFSEVLRNVSSEFHSALIHQDFGITSARHPELLAGTYFQWVTWHDEIAVPSQATETTLKTERLHTREFADGLTAVPPGLADVELTLFETPNGINARGVYSADRFTPRNMDDFMRRLQLAAEFFIRKPDARLNEFCRFADV